MKNRRKILIIGRSGSGKDTLAMTLTKKYHMTQLKSTTTRPRRYEGEDTHVFVTEEEAEQMTDRVAETTINGYQYFATKQQLEECDIYVIDPRGLECLCENAPDVPLSIVYVYANNEVRRIRAIQRADDVKEAARIFDKRHADEDQMFSDFENDVYYSDYQELRKKYPSAETFIVFENNYNNKETIAQHADLIKEIICSDSENIINL